MLEKFPQVLVIPIDNRPVCYDLIHYAANICKDINIFMPDITLLGDLNNSANIDSIKSWTKKVINDNKPDIAIISIDTIAYGGLIPSRRISDSFDKIKKRLDDFITILKQKNSKIKIYAVSSIMRISNNNYNEEEKTYWDKYGKDLFKFSYLSHKLLRYYNVELEAELINLAKNIPFEVVDDYLNTRKRNFEINSYCIDLVKKGVLEQIVFAQDDTAEFGFNVEEKELLQKQAIKEIVEDKVTIKTGADEMIVSLLSKSLVDFCGETINIEPCFFNNQTKNIVSRYEDVSIENSVKATINLCGGNFAIKSGFKLLINTPNKIQDELCLCIFKDEKDNTDTDKLLDYIQKTDDKFMLADVKCANGADSYLINKFLDIPYNSHKFYGFAAWNTTGNTLGTVIATGIIKYLAIKYDCYNEEAFKKSQYVRFLDDWAYQSNVRKVIRQKASTEGVQDDMMNYQNRISEYLGFNIQTYYTFPWNRTFEIKINMDM